MTSVAAGGRLKVKVLEAFAEPAIEAARWDRLVASGTDVVFLTLDWQREWWRAFGSANEQLLILIAERDGQACAIAPLFVEKEMLFLVGSDGSDYLDFIGRLDAPVLTALLDAARRLLGDFAGIGLYHVPRTSRTTALLPRVAEQLGLALYCEGEATAPFADLSDQERVTHLVARRGLRKAEARLRREGPLLARSPVSGELDEWVEQFFDQHELLWSAAEGWRREEARSFLRAIVHAGHAHGWLRFSMLEWRARPAAFEITLVRGERHLSYLGSRDISLDRYSPGAVLQAHGVRAAVAQGARRWDFGLGEEPYKLRDASGVAEVANWFLYPA
jgi:CelD/BcsL family acetyltransferase involved in cellulose biosynthesis